MVVFILFIKDGSCLWIKGLLLEMIILGEYNLLINLLKVLSWWGKLMFLLV